MPFARKAFVVMPFSKDFDDTYEFGIRAACEDACWDCARIDEKVFSGLIIEKLHEEISQADVIIADMTGQNPNVFYEVGYAHASNKRVILLTSKASDIPFDLKGHRHVVYEGSIPNLRKALERELSWILNLNPFKDFLLDNLSVFVMEPSRERLVVVNNYTSLQKGAPIRLRNGLEIQVPGEISNYGKGIFFEFALQIKNSSKMLIDLASVSYRLSFPGNVYLDRDSLRLGHGKLVEEQNDSSLALRGEFTGVTLEPNMNHTIHLFLRTTAHADGQYLTKLPVKIALIRPSEWFDAEVSVEFAPLRRMN